MKETPVQQRTQLEFSEIGPSWRNNVGVLLDARGVPVRFGLANQSKAENDQIKSSDLIGITPTYCYVPGIGWTHLGVLTALETKHSAWVESRTDPHTVAQRRFHDIVRSNGGYAGFVTDPLDIYRIIGREKG